MTLEDFKDVYQDAPPLKKLNLLMETLSRRADAQSISATERWNENWEAEQHWTNEMRVASAEARWLHEELANVLKAQEPRVMTFDEVKAISGTANTVYVERRTKTYYNETAFVSVEKVYGENVTFHGQKSIFGHAKKDYGKEWRCWTSRPTDEQREAEPWA